MSSICVKTPKDVEAAAQVMKLPQQQIYSWKTCGISLLPDLKESIWLAFSSKVEASHVSAAMMSVKGLLSKNQVNQPAQSY